MKQERGRCRIRAHQVLAVGGLALWLGWAAAALAVSDEGRHQAVGKVTKVDGQTGWLELETLGGTVALRFPPAALADVKQGDRIAVDLHFKRTSPAGAPAGAGLVGDPSWRGHHLADSEITRIDADTGLIHVNTAEGAMVMHFLPGDVRALKVGDHLQIAFSFKPCPAGTPCLSGRHR
jgi:hypothetical protein